MFRGAIVTLLLAGIAELALAAHPITSVASAEPASKTDAHLAYGRHLATECTSCHRSDTAAGGIPTLAGRPQAEIVGLLKDFRDGRKTNDVMVSVARSLDEDEMAAVAAYFASLPPPLANAGR